MHVQLCNGHHLRNKYLISSDIHRGMNEICHVQSNWHLFGRRLHCTGRIAFIPRWMSEKCTSYLIRIVLPLIKVTLSYLFILEVLPVLFGSQTEHPSCHHHALKYTARWSTLHVQDKAANCHAKFMVQHVVMKFQLLDNCCTSFSVLVLLLSTHLDSSLYVLMHWWVRSPSRGPNNLYVYEPQQNLGRGLCIGKTCFGSTVINYWPFQGGASVVVY